jgi:hypothetical protein
MNEKFLKERYDEWAGRYEFIYPGTPRGNELLAKADKRSSSMIAEMFEKVEKVEKQYAVELEEKCGSAFLDYTEAGFYAGYEMACYMFHNMIQDSPLSKSDRDRWNSIATLSNVNQYYQKHGRMPNTFEELNQWINDRGETNHEHA